MHINIFFKINFPYQKYFSKLQGTHPWNVSDVTAFLYYCCPECDQKFVFDSEFIHHAITKHEKVSFENIF